MKRIVLLGSTGSIGVSAADVVRGLGEGYELIGLAANSHDALVLAQAAEFKPRWVTLADPAASARLAGRLPPGVKLLPPGAASLVEMACHPDTDLVVSGLVGAAGFEPLMAAVRAGKTIALANKEPMVMAGAAIMEQCVKHGAKIIPVDSEPSAVFQCLEGADDGDYRAAARAIARVFLTASGGPFLNYKGKLDEVTPAQALKHPRWKMGPKITIDSATLMNKGFEAIELMNMFGLRREQVRTVIHPQSVIHSAVEYEDSSVLAQLSLPDMRLPIQYAITWPGRRKSPVAPLNLFELGRLEFFEPDFSRFPCLALAEESYRRGGTYPAAASAADEVAVDAFLKGRLKFTGIAGVVEYVLNRHDGGSGSPSLDAAVNADEAARRLAGEAVSAA
ncbi:MAG: 1-deoxy-D-xylulose-5-phosphate reductoisomerase [Elusimicrobiaceae bacterium]|nr:1-deoxy-D-xylulose-5-phosphate reductoisomerase [Elusimicrobiaceae bacterium]